VVSDLVGGDYPSTKTVLSALTAVTASQKVLVVIGRDEDAVWLSLRNVATVHAIAADQLNAYDVLVNDEIVFTETALATFIAGPASGRAAKAVATSTEVDAIETDQIAEPTNDELAQPTNVVLAEPSNVELAEPADVELVEPTDAEPVEPTYDEVAIQPSTDELAAEADGVEAEETPEEETK
jgi:large subunit ribosomal protein L4